MEHAFSLWLVNYQMFELAFNNLSFVFWRLYSIFKGYFNVSFLVSVISSGTSSLSFSPHSSFRLIDSLSPSYLGCLIWSLKWQHVNIAMSAISSITLFLFNLNFISSVVTFFSLLHPHHLWSVLSFVYPFFLNAIQVYHWDIVQHTCMFDVYAWTEWDIEWPIINRLWEKWHDLPLTMVDIFYLCSNLCPEEPQWNLYFMWIFMVNILQ